MSECESCRGTGTVYRTGEDGQPIPEQCTACLGTLALERIGQLSIESKRVKEEMVKAVDAARAAGETWEKIAFFQGKQSRQSAYKWRQTQDPPMPTND